MKQPGKLIFSSSLTKRNSSNNLIFGSWGIDTEIKSEENLTYFLPNPFGIKNPNLPLLIPIIGIGDTSIDDNYLTRTFVKLSMDQEIMESHSDWNSCVDISKHNLILRSKGSIGFLEKVEGGFGKLYIYIYGRIIREMEEVLAFHCRGEGFWYFF